MQNLAAQLRFADTYNTIPYQLSSIDSHAYFHSTTNQQVDKFDNNLIFSIASNMGPAKKPGATSYPFS